MEGVVHNGYSDNKDGIRTSLHECDTCGVEFSLCPAIAPDEPGWDNCLDDDCESYDPHRDMDILFMTAAEIAREKRIISIKKLQERRDSHNIITKATRGMS